MAAGLLASWQGDLAPATELLSASLREAHVLGDRHQEAMARILLATALRRQGDVQQALDFAEAGLRQARELADESLIALALLRGGIVYRDAEAPDRAVPALEASVALYRRLGDVRSVAIAVTMLGWALLEAGDHAWAEPCLRDGANGLKQVGDQSFFLFALRGLAYVAHQRREDIRAARWYGACEALRVALGMRHPRRILEHDERFLAAVQARLTVPAYERARAEGEALTFDQVAAEVVAAT
jgi:tetratricopeptide (TPR) repeat protein